MIVIVTLIIASIFIYRGYISYSKCPIPKEEIISAEEAADKAIDYINQNILAGQATVSLTGVSEENGVYKVSFTLQGQGINSYVSRNGNLLFPDGLNLTEGLDSAEEPVVEEGTTIGNFSISQDEICKENGKPIVYFFGSESCPHCNWEHPIIEEVASRFEANISFHDNMDADKDMEVFQKYSTGGVPTSVLGCKYYRVGSGETLGEDEEAKVLTAIICKLTGNQPKDVCDEVKDLIDQIE